MKLLLTTEEYNKVKDILEKDRAIFDIQITEATYWGMPIDLWEIAFDKPITPTQSYTLGKLTKI